MEQYMIEQPDDDDEQEFDFSQGDAQVELARFFTDESIQDWMKKNSWLMAGLDEEEKKQLKKHITHIFGMFYAYTGRKMMLSNFDSTDIFIFQQELDMSINAYISAIPVHEITEKLIISINMLRQEANINIKASKNGFSRKMLNTRFITQQKHSSTEFNPNVQNQSFVGRLLGGRK